MIDKGINRVWLQHYDKEVAANLRYEHIGMYEILIRAVSVFFLLDAYLQASLRYCLECFSCYNNQSYF